MIVALAAPANPSDAMTPNVTAKPMYDGIIEAATTPRPVSSTDPGTIRRGPR
jgi:hypothetical protein